MIEFHYLIYILFLTATSSKQISVGVILPFYDGLWGYYGDQFLLYNKNQTKTEYFSIEVYYCKKLRLFSRPTPLSSFHGSSTLSLYHPRNRRH